MSKKQAFIDYVEELIVATDGNRYPVVMSEDARVYWEALKAKEETEKPLFTEGGKAILKWMQDNYSVFNNTMSAKQIGDGLFMSGRSVSGSIRKLITLGLVDKRGKDPVCYSLTEIGKQKELD